MKVRITLAGLLALAAMAAGSCSQATVEQPPDRTQKVALKAGVTTQVMPMATVSAGDANPLRVSPMVARLNEAWKSLFVGLDPSKPTVWGNAGVGLVAASEEYEALCLPHQPFDITQAHGIYCVAPTATGAGAVNPYVGNIVFPNQHFRAEAAVVPGNRTLRVSLLIAYFYTLHLQQLMRKTDLVAAQWGGTSQTQWCLTGVNLKALGVFKPPATSSGPSPSVNELLPLNLVYVFSGEVADDRHPQWVLDGFNAPSINSCFATT